MRKLLLAFVAALFGLMLSWDGGPVLAARGNAVIGRPGTPWSLAGVHRRHMRRAYGLGWRAGGVYSRYRPTVWWRHGHLVHRHPFVAGAALGYGGGCSCPGYGYGWGAPGVGGWGSGFGYRPGFGFGAPGFGWHRGWF
jgi:hypothetical protein